MKIVTLPNARPAQQLAFDFGFTHEDRVLRALWRIGAHARTLRNDAWWRGGWRAAVHFLAQRRIDTRRRHVRRAA